MSQKTFLTKLLVPVDGSRSSIMAEETAAAIAKKTGASVTVLHAKQELEDGYDHQQFPPIPRVDAYEKVSDSASSDFRQFSELQNIIERQAERIVNNALALFSEVGVKTDSVIKMGDPAENILEYSKKDFDLTVMGACGENEKDACTLGSVTKKIMLHTKCPTLIVKEVTFLSNLLVCVDGSDHAVNALNYATNLAQKMGGKITLLNVQDHRIRKVSPKTAEELGNRIISKSLETIKKEKLQVNEKVEFGVPSNVIVEVAEKEKYDLIVLGNRGLGTVTRFLLGSVSDDVAHKAKCSVLIAR